MCDRPRFQIAAVLLAWALSSIAMCRSSSALAATPMIAAEQQREVIAALSSAIAEHYVVPSKAELLIDGLARSEADGAFSKPIAMADFVAHTNEILQAASPDKHLRLLEPAKFQEMMRLFHGAESGVSHPSSDEPTSKPGHSKLPDNHSSHAPSAGPADRTERAAQSQREVGVSGFAEISRDGLNQTGYLALERFDASARSVAFIDRVFHIFTESDNIIIDLRGCKGGEAEMVMLLSSYFFAEPTLLMRTTMPAGIDGKRAEFERWTSPGALSKTYASKPLTILISDKTFSAAESFSFAMKNLGRAELIGTRSGGGGYSNDFFPLPHGMGASISVGRSFDPATGKDWQGVGVTPDVEVPQDHALSTALARFTKSSGKLDGLRGAQLAIYQQVQSYANAWYGAQPDLMETIVDDAFRGTFRDQTDAIVKVQSKRTLIEQTAEGMGVRKNQLYNNRIVRDITIDGKQATVTLVLRESLHVMTLSQIRGTWLIRSDDYKDKVHG